MAHHLDQLLAALLGEGRDGKADDAAIVGGVNTDVGVLDGLLDCLDHAGVVGLDDDHARLGHTDRRQLIEGHGGAVSLNRQMLNQAG